MLMNQTVTNNSRQSVLNPFNAVVSGQNRSLDRRSMAPPSHPRIDPRLPPTNSSKVGPYNYAGSFIQEDEDEDRSSIASKQRISEMMLNIEDISMRQSILKKNSSKESQNSNKLRGNNNEPMIISKTQSPFQLEASVKEKRNTEK